MASANDDSANPKDDLDKQLPTDGGADGTMHPIPDGLYTITNKMARMLLDTCMALILVLKETVKYFVLPSELRRSLWDQTDLQQQLVKPHLFDYDLFVIKTKDKVQFWARDEFPVEIRGFGVLFGIIYGEAKKELRAYNWYLTDDMCLLIFFDPLTGREYSTEALDRSGFEPIFATL
ncbi:hypothetical protein FS837_010163 [Tulasnella sp. UAMH 9824]|nr:hypothetical protein FS837_010163 [Tulasnella sp. UAMH 9824]